MVPGEKLFATTSLRPMMARAISRARGFLRSSVMLRLLVLRSA
jgi:hypothetical protein